MIEHILKAAINPYYLFYVLAMKYDRLHWMQDDTFLKLVFRGFFGKKLDLDNPKTFNEKIQWLKLYDRRPEYTDMVDKYKVRNFVAQTIGKEYLIPLLGVWDSFDDIDFSKLPNQFVLKCTHDCGSVVLCKDKTNFDYNAARKSLSSCLKRNAFYYGREWPYKNVVPRIVAEEFVSDGRNDSELTDYKFFCFNGKAEYCLVISGRFSNQKSETFFDRDWRPAPFSRRFPTNTDYPRPRLFNEMLNLADKLSGSFPFVRVDLYQVDDRVYFGETTFFPGSGLEKFYPDEWDCKLGRLITLPVQKTKVIR